MCGKYILAQAAKAERAMRIQRGHWEYPLSYRVLPTEQIPVVVAANGEREAALMRWGLVPWWTHGVPLKASTINATAERLEHAPSYRDPWRRGQRCLFVMGGFYEPHLNEDGSRDRTSCASPIAMCLVLRASGSARAARTAPICSHAL